VKRQAPARKKKVAATKKPVSRTSRKKPAAAKKTVAAKPIKKKTAAAAKRTKAPAVKKAAVKKAIAKTVAKPAKPARRPAKAPTRKAAAAPKAITGKQVAKQKKSAVPAFSASTDAPKSRPAPYKETAGEEYMNPNQSEHFQQLLLNWRRELMEEVDRTVHHMQDDAANFPDPNDRATQEEEFALELRTRDRERKLIKKINESLAALDAGTYGYCEMCGIEIGIKRLEARPTATLCIDCKTLDEIREKQRA
jgi:DnaK suppressor protein